MKSEKLQTILDEDLIGLLKEIKMFDDIENGNVCCHICSIRINLQNLQLLVPMTNGTFRFVCSDVNCVESYYNKSVE
jgi:hypothetical protein